MNSIEQQLAEAVSVKKPEIKDVGRSAFTAVSGTKVSKEKSEANLKKLNDFLGSICIN